MSDFASVSRFSRDYFLMSYSFTIRSLIYSSTRVAGFNGAEVLFIVASLVFIFDVTQVVVRLTKVRVHLAAWPVLMITCVEK